MSWFPRKKSADPLTVREQELQAEISRLQEEVGRLVRENPAPVVSASSPGTRPYAAPIRPSTVVVAPRGNEHFNEYGGAKFDFQAVWNRWMQHLRGPTSNNPRMAKMLAAGSIQGLRTLRYERRVARNRFIALFVILLLILWGLGYTYLRNN
ncbi:MAG TPA: hypothetical protein PLX89_22515 [Verrucomicrobiota bacterium]|nr:hypothetical protein [Verrucomicrobiales bacterium]HRI15780.1 hypothetical protein [Verrucomicrobiota bacterium]